MAKEYIERKAAIKMIEEDLPEVVYYHKEDAIACLECLPSADVVEVVRCEDCRYCDKYHNWNNREYFGCNYNGEITEVLADHYCSYGERRED